MMVLRGESQLVRREITCENLGLKLKSGHVVLQDINYTFGSGQITALMGPSGSGKTSLLTTIAGRANYGLATGRTLINGVQRDLNRYSRSIGFVPQEDVMPRDCTVTETLSFSANIRLDRYMSQRQKQQIVHDVQVLLGLDDIGNSLIGDEVIRGVSGGQRKRVNLGIELVSQASGQCCLVHSC
jgi:ABC-type multidrug transport system ATPase subunit